MGILVHTIRTKNKILRRRSYVVLDYYLSSILTDIANIVGVQHKHSLFHIYLYNIIISLY
jgi:hypothetical protein